jgi:hypothetical protein
VHEIHQDFFMNVSFLRNRAFHPKENCFLLSDMCDSAAGITSLFARLISHQPAVLFSQNEPATSRNQPAVLFSQNKPAPAISHQPTERH